MDYKFVEINDYWSYLRSIDWTDPWLIGLVLFHVATTVLTILTRKKLNFQFFMLVFLLTTVYFSEYLNEYAARYWHMFSKQQYFDSNGLFIGTVFSMPILLNCMFLIGTWLQNSYSILSKLKIAKQRVQTKENNKKKD